ncbi:MAG: cadherin domain-containing protein [Cyclobacteriaceae bacterium]
MKKVSNLLFVLAAASTSIFISCVADDGLTNSAPEIENQTFTIIEEAVDGTSIGTIKASDDDSDALTFTVLSGNTNSVFALNVNSGELTVSISSELDFDITPTYSLTVQVTDGKESASATITVNVTEEEEPILNNNLPVINEQSFEIQENSPQGTVIGAVQATDSDNDKLTFSITAGNENSVFSLDEESGELKVEDSKELDFETTPEFMLTVSVSDGKGASVNQIIVKLTDQDPEYYQTEAEVLAGISSAYALLEILVEHSYLFDAVYSNTISAPSTGWNEVHDHTLTSSNDKVLALWDAAFDLVFTGNNIAESADLVSSDSDVVLAQAKVFRAYAYIQLASWFGQVPIEFGIAEDNTPWNTINDVLTLTISYLDEAQSVLSSTQTVGTDGNYIFTSDFAASLKIRVYQILNSNGGNNFADIRAIGTNLINSGNYSLSSATNNFQDGDSEIIWGFDKSSGTGFSSLFTKGDFVPGLRITEIYLSDIQARGDLGVGGTPETIALVNQIKVRDGLSTVTSLTNQEFIDFLVETYKNEMKFEGIDFYTLKRFDIATTELGIPDFRLLLPVPQSVLDSNQNAIQNPGY